MEDVDDLAVVGFLFDRDLEKILQASILRASPGTGISETKSSEKEVTLFPNPAQNILYFSLGKAADNQGRIKVMDLAGRLVTEADMEAGQSIRPVDISGLSEGVYLVNWMESGIIKGRAKFIIAR